MEVLANNLAEVLKRPKAAAATQTAVGEPAFTLMEQEVEIATARNALLKQGSIESVVACANLEGKKLCRSDNFSLFVVGTDGGMFTVRGGAIGGDSLNLDNETMHHLGIHTTRRGRRKRAVIGLDKQKAIGLERMPVARRRGLHAVFLGNKETIKRGNVATVTDTRTDRHFSPDLDDTRKVPALPQRRLILTTKQNSQRSPAHSSPPYYAPPLSRQLP